MYSPRKATSPHRSVTAEQARTARARAWAFVFDCYGKKKAAPASRPDDAERSLSDGAKNIIQDTK
jgi:hypothetical protein